MIGKVSTFSGPSGLFQGTGASPSLVLSLDANNVLSYPGTGLTWSDLTIFNNDTVFTVGDPTYSISGGGSFQFGDIDDSFVLAATANGFPLGDSQYTIETWINPDNLSQFTALVVYGTLGENSANAIGLSNSSIFVDWVDNNLSSPTQSMIPGNWYYLSSTYNGTDRKIYLNGSLIASDTPGVTHSITTGDSFTIGSIMGQPFTGKISIVKLHTKALSSSRLLSNFNSLKNRFGYTFGSMTFNDAQSSYLISNSSDYAFGTNDFTVEAFFKSATSSDSFAGVVSLRNNDIYNNGVNINLISADTSTPLIEFSAGGNFLTYTASIDEWYHVAISRTGGTSSLFVNGNLFNEVADTLIYENNDLVVGRYHTTVNDYYFNGVISNVRVINGTGLYTGTFSIPDVQLGLTSSTKLLITSQQTTPGADVSGLLQSVTASNIGWTSSLPIFVPNVVIDSLQFYVDAGQVSSYPGTGTTWYDISGNSRNLTMDSLSYNSNNGGYIIFDGSHTADSVATYSINFSNGFTVESVAKFSGSGLEGLFAFNNQMTSDYINVQAQDGINVRWEIESGQSFTSSNSLTSSTWYHFTCVYEGDSNNTSGTARIYINGVENNTTSLNSNRTGQIQTSNFVLGLWDGYLTGNIALSRMYNKVLTPIEVLQNFNATKNRFGL
jgi:hypothetical protein